MSASTAITPRSAFHPIELKAPNFLHRWLGLTVKRNVVAEVNNLLATRPVREVSADDVQRLATAYKVDPHRKFATELKALYQQQLRHCLIDRRISEEEFRELQHLKQILAISDREISRIHEEVLGEVYQGEVEKVMTDGRVSEEEKRFLRKLEEEIRLPKVYAERIYAQKAHEKLQKRLSAAVEDERVSPEEEAELQAMARSFGVQIEMDTATRAQLQRYRLYWKIENGDLAAVEVDINLQRGETCYFTAPMEWYEMRTVTRSIRYGGPSARIRLAKGIYYRVGSVQVQRVSEDVMKLIDTGTIYLTNKRLVFMGAKKNSTTRLNKILDFTPYSNGVEIQKDSGKSPFLGMTSDIDLFALTLDRCLRDS